MTGQTLSSQVLRQDEDDCLLEDGLEGDNEGMAQKRGQGLTEQDKFRITFEACQEILDYVQSPEVEPKGRIGKSKLVIPGAHANLSNISDEHTIIEDEAFVYEGIERIRKAGQKVSSLMCSWVELRHQNPEVRKMLEKIEVYQQPSGFVDNIIF